MREFTKPKIFHYGGYHMRSFTETRWAGMMESVGISWLYEPQVFNTRHGWYLPDFYIPAAGLYVEVKGPNPTQVEIEKAQDVEEITGCPVLIAHGKPEILSGELFHGVISYYFDGRELSWATPELGEYILAGMGMRAFEDFKWVGAIGEYPESRPIREIAEEYLAGAMDRPELEASIKARNAPLNAKKASMYRQHTKTESVIACLASRVNAAKERRKCK